MLLASQEGQQMFSNQDSGGISRRITVRRAAVALGVAAAFAVAPIAAQAATTAATGTLSGGSISNTAPVISPFTATLTGVNQTVDTAVGGWDVDDATGASPGYTVTVTAGVPFNNVTALTASLGSTWMTLTPNQAVADADNPAPPSTAPVPAGPQALGATAATIDSAAINTGSGQWDFPADTGAAASLAVVIPGDAQAGSYSDTLTFTSAPLV
jgi:hypothetical protein